MHTTLTQTGLVSVLKIEGQLDATNALQLREVNNAIVASTATTVEVDLSELRLIDASGVGAIVSLYKGMRARGGELVVKKLQKQPLAIFKLLAIERAIKCE